MAKKLFRMLRNLTIKQQMLFGVGLTLAILAIVASVSIYTMIEARNTTQSMAHKNQPTVITATQLSDSVKQSMVGLGLYLTTKNKSDKKIYVDHLEKTERLLRLLTRQVRVLSGTKAQKSVQIIEDQFKKYKSYRDRLLNLIENERANFPAMSYATDKLNPATQVILSSISVMISIEESRDKPRYKFIKLLNNMRYQWARIMTAVRGFLGYRAGRAIVEYLDFKGVFDTNFKVTLDNYKDNLTLEQEEKMDIVRSTVKEFYINADSMFAIHGSDKWRADAYLIRSEINPVLLKLDSEINRFTKKQISEFRVASNSVADHANLSVYIIMTMLGIAMLTVLALSLLFSKGLINPLGRVVKAGINSMVEILNTVAGEEGQKLLKALQGRGAKLDTINAYTHTIELMSSSLKDAYSQQKQASDILKRKVDGILSVIQKASAGDLTAKVSIDGDESIDRLAAGVQKMMNSLSELVNKIQDAGAKVTISTASMAQIVKEHEATVTEQAASTNEVMATVMLINATSKDLVHTMGEVSSVAEATADSASDSQNELDRMAATMSNMKDATEVIATKLATLNEKASNISNVVTTINRVADQTNLLSLNAAIEAEKAGEFGKGFAVVATEIRRLADQTAVATWDIEQMIKETLSSLSAGVMGMEKFTGQVNTSVEEVAQVSSHLGVIIDQAQTLSPKFDLVDEGVRSQSDAAIQINESMVQLNETAHETAKSLSATSGSIEELSDAAIELQDIVSRFKVK